MKLRKQSKREQLVSSLAAVQRLREEKPSWFRPHDFARLDREWAAKSAELVALEVRNYRKKLGWKPLKSGG